MGAFTTRNLYQPVGTLTYKGPGGEEELGETKEAGAVRSVKTVKNAFVEDIFTYNRTGVVTISYGIIWQNRIVEMQVVNLVVGHQTQIWDQFGNRIGFRSLTPGMVVDASFSMQMTKSSPPQARAYTIRVVRERKSSLMEEARVLDVTMDQGFGYLLTGVPNRPNRQMRYVISPETKLRDRQGNRIRLQNIRPGQTVRIEREAFQTMSIPPQTNALSVQVISR